jgi:hypothetical protein
MYDVSPSRPALVAPRRMMRHHDPDGMGGYAAAGRACTSDRSNGALSLSRLASWGQHEVPFEESPIGHRHMAGDLSNPPRVRMWCQACHLHLSSAKEDGQHASKAVRYAPPSLYRNLVVQNLFG